METIAGTNIYSVFMSGIPYECNEDKIRKFFDNSEAIVKVNLPKYQGTERCLGYAHVEFNRKKDFEQALAKNKQKIDERYIDIAPSKGKNAKQIVPSRDPPPD